MKPTLTWSIEKVMDASFEATRNMIDETKPKELTPIFFGITAVGREIVIACPWNSDEEKLAGIQAVKRLFAQHKVVSYTQMSEIWTSDTLVEEAKANGGKITRQPSDMPDREERVMIVGCNGLKTCMRTYFMDRDGEGRITGLRLEEEHSDIELGGRMAGLLPRREAAGTA